MGLDAVVYKKKEHLQLGADERLARLNPQTGEVWFEDPKAATRYAGEVRAAGVKLGNIAAISELREEIGRMLGPDSLLYKKILYSGSHAGDMISIDQFPLFSAEISRIRTTNKQSPGLREFLKHLEGLICTALHEGNPIVFV